MPRKGRNKLPQKGHVVLRLESSAVQPAIISSSYTNNVPDTTITIPGYVRCHGQNKPISGGGTLGYSQEGVALGVLNMDPMKSHGFSQKWRVDDPSRPPPVVSSITDTSLQSIRFTPRDINKRMETLDTTMATGPDNIPAIVLKTCARELATPLFQYSYNTGIYPAMRKI
eukprot:g40432.t1